MKAIVNFFYFFTKSGDEACLLLHRTIFRTDYIRFILYSTANTLYQNSLNCTFSQMVLSVASTCIVPFDVSITFFSLYNPGLCLGGIINPLTLASSGILPPSLLTE